MKKGLLILLCLPMIGFGQTELTQLLFQLIDAKNVRNQLYNEGWTTNSVNNYTDEYDVNYTELKLFKRIDFNEGNSSRCYFTIKEYSNYSNIVTLKIYSKSFYSQFEKAIKNSAYNQITKETENNITETVYQDSYLEITFKEALNNYYQIMLLNYKEKERRAQEFDEDDIDIEEDDDDEVFMVVENMPVFPGGDLGLMKYIQKNVKYPPIAKEYNITGKVYISFVVDKSGSVTNVKVVRGVDKNLDAEAVRVIKSLPKYKPGKQRGKAVKVRVYAPINFTLN